MKKPNKESKNSNKMGGKMSNLLNEEIKAIQLYKSHLEKAIPLETDSGRKQKLKDSWKKLNSLLSEKLNQCEDFKG